MLAPDQPDPRAWAILWTRARKRRGWGYVRLATAIEVDESTVIRACTTGRCSAQTALKLSHALGLTLILPQSHVYTAQEAQRGG